MTYGVYELVPTKGIHNLFYVAVGSYCVWIEDASTTVVAFYNVRVVCP